mmetsp:Transcript_994/g.4457  ORF Transcript_994/g.4457 Transcript_994/m.4457 type:complete len:213 (-) Transcript_994:95-733(-)
MNLEVVVERLPCSRELRVRDVERRRQRPGRAFPFLLDGDGQRQVCLHGSGATFQALELCAEAVQELAPGLDAILERLLLSLELFLALAHFLPLRQLVRQPLQHHRVRVVPRFFPLRGCQFLEFGHGAQPDRVVVVGAAEILARAYLLLDVSLLVHDVLQLQPLVVQIQLGLSRRGARRFDPFQRRSVRGFQVQEEQGCVGGGVCEGGVVAGG